MTVAPRYRLLRLFMRLMVERRGMALFAFINDDGKPLDILDIAIFNWKINNLFQEFI